MTMTDLDLFGSDLSVPMILPNGDTARTRRNDPETSHAAADSNINREQVEEHVVHLFSIYGPMTDHELTLRYFVDTTSPVSDFDSPRKRRSDLAKAGRVVATTIPGKSKTGRKATVWALVANLSGGAA